MEKVTLIRYKSIDGRLFVNEQDCIDYEFWYEKGVVIISQLRERYIDTNCDYSNGRGYIQHNNETVSKVKSEFLKLATDMGISSGRDVSYFFNNNHLGLYGLHHRTECIDSFGREFGQTFYALNPDKAELIEL